LPKDIPICYIDLKPNSERNGKMPTLKQETAIRKVSENIGKPIGEIMRESGYSESTSKTPQRLTESKAWTQLMEDYIPDDTLLDKHKEALNATKQIGAQILIDKEGKTISKENEGMIEVPDQITRLKAVELGYRVKGKLRPEEGATLEAKILVIPSELIAKYDTTVTPDTSNSSQG
jgi:hypothetical protein